MPYNTIFDRASQPTPDPFVPEQLINEIVEQAPQQSAVMQRSKQIRLATNQARMPLLSSLPDAYWVQGDTGLKQTTKPAWANQYINVEELAAIVVVPDAYFDDRSVPLWDQVRPLIVEAMARKIDEATLFGVDKPASWPTDIYHGALASGNWVLAGSGGVDLGVSIARLNKKLADDGQISTGYIGEPGFEWRLVEMRDSTGAPVYSPISQAGPGTIYGRPVSPVENGAWDVSEALLFAGDWRKSIIGLRQDVTINIVDTGVISDQSGNIIINLFQQDAKAMRVVMRLGWTVVNPLNRLNQNANTRYPFGVLQSTTANS